MNATQWKGQKAWALKKSTAHKMECHCAKLPGKCGQLAVWGGFVMGWMLALMLVLSGAAALAQSRVDRPDDTRAGQWLTLAPMQTARSRHTATLLEDGSVLVVGGMLPGKRYQPARSHASAELYVPAQDTWIPLPDMEVARLFHTATRLQDGRVLVVGGVADTRSTAVQAELYEPGRRQWLIVDSSATQQRVMHAAVLLHDGRVLVMGGAQPQGGRPVALNSAELYDPQQRRWLPAAAMHEARMLHTATILADGRVLVVGGVTIQGNMEIALSHAEIYDPIQNVWQPAGEMFDSRYMHTATLLEDGAVLVAAGMGTRQSQAQTSRPEIRNTAELYRGASVWDVSGFLLEPRSEHTASLLRDGRVWIVGGGTPVMRVNAPLASVEVYDPVARRWGVGAAMTQERMGHSATVLSDGRLLVVGGESLSGGLSSVEALTLEP